MAVTPTSTNLAGSSPNALNAIASVGYPTPGTTANAPAAPVVQAPAPATPPVVSAPPAVTAPGAVITSGAAKTDASNKIGVVNQLGSSQKTQQVPMATLVNSATGDRKAVAVGSQDAQNLFANGYVLEGAKGAGAAPPTPAKPAGPAGLTAPPETPKAPDTETKTDAAVDEFTANNQAITDKADAAFNDYNTQVNQMRNGTFPLTPDQQAMIDNISSQYQGLIADQKMANQNYQAAVKLSGIRAGRNMYAPEIDLGNVNAAMSKGVRDIADLNTKMSSAIATARIAYQESNFKMLDSVYDRIRQHMEDQRKVVSDTYTATKDALAASQQKFQNDMASAQFEFQKVQELNKPILEADKQMKDYLYDQASKYPDAGITAEDTVQSAVDKIKASPAYKAEQEKAAAELAQTKAQTNAANASAAASYASAAKSRADAAAGGSGGQITDAFIRDAATGIAINLPKAQGEQFMAKVQDAVNSGDQSRIREALRQGVRASLPVADRTAYDGRVTAIDALDNLKTAIKFYESNGGKMGYLKGTYQQIENRLGQITDPKLQEIATRAQASLIAYRRAVSGAAFTEAESKQYAAIFPTSKATADLNVNKIDTLRNVFNENNSSAVGSVIGKDSYDAIYGNSKATSSAAPQEGQTKEYQGTTYKLIKGVWTAQ